MKFFVDFIQINKSIVYMCVLGCVVGERVSLFVIILFCITKGVLIFLYPNFEALSNNFDIYYR